MDGDMELVAEEARKYEGAVGKGIPDEVVAELIEFGGNAMPDDYYKDPKNRHAEFWYERLEKDGWQEKIGAVADLWVQSDENVQRAAAQVGRPAKPPHRQLVRAFCICRFKQRSHKQWKRLPGGPGMDGEPQTVVCIALEDLGPDNGLFFELQSGKDVCIDGTDQILLPPSGGGLIMLI
ncbi:hypothetical protein LTR37_001435 [Vermiconidia calcicola]|uniref:Uncharacterized protein n=1 Tax=Vermiconidia calcicola TaxID=1690605 RepID=A0ACC3NVJ3_9PEZI|nr:hypothetical protein LTR37_001435 [Vermiconidia calcicola]